MKEDVLIFNVKVGEIVKEVDGIYVFYPTPNNGAFTSWVLNQIIKRLDDLNKI
jgi:hypothetical protein